MLTPLPAGMGSQSFLEFRSTENSSANALTLTRNEQLFVFQGVLVCRWEMAGVMAGKRRKVKPPADSARKKLQ